ncbi:MAG: hypothetical protein JKX91_03520 [Rhizobiaceae bacterium]|nr:hypothetical protein [Rhizobiaceae bacterium]
METPIFFAKPTSVGKWLIYNGDGRLFKISPDGQTGPIRINTAPFEKLNNDHCLAPNGKTIFISSGDGHLYSVPIEGGVPKKISNDQDPSRTSTQFQQQVDLTLN